MDGSPPERKFAAGPIVASVWKNDAGEGKGVFHSVTLDRSYKDKWGAWKNTHALRVSDLPKASLVLSKAYDFLVSKQGNIEKQGDTTEVSE